MTILNWELNNNVLVLNSDQGQLKFHGVDVVTYDSNGISADQYRRINSDLQETTHFTNEEIDELIQEAALNEQEILEDDEIHPSMPAQSQDTFEKALSVLEQTT